MNGAYIMTFIALLLVGCGKQSAAQREAHDRAKPGYQMAKSFCSQCHALPFSDQHPPAAWPYVVSRMEGYMQAQEDAEPGRTTSDHRVFPKQMTVTTRFITKKRPFACASGHT